MSSFNLIHGDCIELLKDIPDSSVDLVLSDPPYFIDYKTNHRKDKDHIFCDGILNDKYEDKDIIMENFLRESYRVLKDNTSIFIFGSWKTIDLWKPCVEKYFNIKNILIWIKNNWTSGDLNGQYAQQYETIIYANKGRYIIEGNRLPDVWDFSRVAGNNQYHPNEKPIDLLAQIIKRHSKVNDTVLDPFMGSGSTGVASISVDRNFIGFEKDEKYFRYAEKRCHEYSCYEDLDL
jgi:site-specific DNA-methyltransferase (adenine-specific)